MCSNLFRPFLTAPYFSWPFNILTSSTYFIARLVYPCAVLLSIFIQESSRGLLEAHLPAASASQSSAKAQLLITTSFRVSLPPNIPLPPNIVTFISSNRSLLIVYLLQCLTCNFSVFCFSYRLSRHCVKFQCLTIALVLYNELPIFSFYFFDSFTIAFVLLL